LQYNSFSHKRTSDNIENFTTNVEKAVGPTHDLGLHDLAIIDILS